MFAAIIMSTNGIYLCSGYISEVNEIQTVDLIRWNRDVLTTVESTRSSHDDEL